MNKPYIGVFGSAFDPPTLGHLDVLQQAVDHFDRILLVPSASHAFSKKSQSFLTRLALLNVFVDAISIDAVLEVCDLEAKMLQQSPGKPVYTFDVLKELEKSYRGSVNLSFIRGPDNAESEVWSRFYKAEEIEQRWPIFTAKERVDIRSSKVRSILGSIVADGNNTLDDLLLPTVKNFIRQHKLYQGNL
ncbi:hypothetical protein ACH42_13750 [Endozoicomonas sp. (ex Bugula neritina AB1)]|nr:hypothetical protein ACH42_13750 [Endozoicomonas sp. (ex Bugula neritina AB1)]